MAHAYTPGLRVTRGATVKRFRQLPIKGEVLVSEGDLVKRDQVVAKTDLPGNVTTLNLVNTLSVTPSELPDYMMLGEGDTIVKGQPIAETRPFIKWFKTTIEAPIDGTIESISRITGQVIIREAPRPVEVNAYIDGTVAETMPNEGVVVETRGAFIQGIFGVGGETWGPLHLLADKAGQNLDKSKIDKECSGKIVVGSGLTPLDAILKAKEVAAVGIIGAGLRDADLRELLGYDLGVAITGSEQIGLTVIVTEGFGEIGMANKTFEILSENADAEASISGATQIRAGVQRPEMIIPNPTNANVKSESGSISGLEPGALLRVIRAPYFGKVGEVSDLPPELRMVESETNVRVLEVTFENGEKAIVPRANVELIEE